jgi:anti-sigma factor RsiW
LNCKNAIKEISDYLDGELDPVVRQQLAQHLSECKECTIIVSQTKLTVELFCDAEMVPLPEQVSTRLHQALRAKLNAADRP